MSESNTALLFFSRSPAAESACKHLSGEGKKDARLWRSLYDNTLSVARSTTLPLLICEEGDQVAGSFGEKITHAIANAFSAGYENLIVIGGDCPGLKKNHILAAEKALLNGARLVAGPDTRGGVYLLGLHNSAFQTQPFLNFSWQSPWLYRELCVFASEAAPLHVLSFPLRDIHNGQDALAVAGGGVFLPWQLLVTSLLQSPVIHPNYVNPLPLEAGGPGLFLLRAPPGSLFPAIS